jgi:hypothetical protein
MRSSKQDVIVTISGEEKKNSWGPINVLVAIRVKGY